MTLSDYTTCAFCPRLCRHVCPVAVATGAEAATPSAMMSVPLLAARDVLPPADALRGTSLCLGCGACTAHCKVHVPVAERLAGWRREEGGESASPAALAAVEGDARFVAVITGEDWSGAWSATTGERVARLRTDDELGHAAWRRGAEGWTERVARHLHGRVVVTASGAVAEVAAAAGLEVRWVEGAVPAGAVEFHTCFAGPRSGPGQLACCGRREGFPEREPEAARQVAEENVRLLAGAESWCRDEGCASWLRAHGARITSPTDALSSRRTNDA